jgi:hypothetical protein
MIQERALKGTATWKGPQGDLKGGTMAPMLSGDFQMRAAWCREAQLPLLQGIRPLRIVILDTIHVWHTVSRIESVQQ